MARRIVPTPPPSSPVVSDAQVLGAAVRNRRTHQGVRIDNAAAACGVSVQLMSDMEGGKRNVRLDNAIRVAAQFGLSLLVIPNERLAAVEAALKGVQE
jgi:transcriptional regulator with XRE-family HTH domain